MEKSIQTPKQIATTQCLASVDLLEISEQSLLNSIMTFTIFQFIFVLVSNTMLIIGLFKTNKSLPISQKLFIYLSLVDILTSVLNLVRKTIFFAENPCQIINLLRDFIFLVVLLSSMFFLNICFLRYWSIKEPLKPVSNTTVYAVIGLELTFFLISGVLLSYFLIAKKEKSKKSFFVVLDAIGRCFVVAMIFVNFMSFRLLKRQTITIFISEQSQTNECDQATPSNPEDISENQTSIQRRKQSRKAVITLSILTACYLLCAVPVFIFTMAPKELTNNSATRRSLLLEFLLLVWLSNTGINSIVYILRTKRLQSYFFRRLLCRRRQVAVNDNVSSNV